MTGWQPAKLMLALTVALCLGAAAVIVLLQHRNGEDRDAEVRAEKIKSALTQLQIAPYGAVAPGMADPRYARQENRFARDEIAGGKEEIDGLLDDLESGSPPAQLSDVRPLLDKNFALVDKIYELGATGGPPDRIDRLGFQAGRVAGKLNRTLKAVGAEYHERAVASRNQSIAGSTVTIILLLCAFSFFLLRGGRLQREKDDLLERLRKDALTDSLTGLGNRRALIDDLEQRIAESGPDREFILAVFDLDGFKRYNDSFGHPAGDALLARLGGRLQALVGPGVAAYRMGGDEFCVLAELGADGAEVVARASEALTESGEAFYVGCSYGTVVIPAEASTSSDALRISDGRMYRVKAVRGAATRESIDVLLKVLEERNGELVGHLHAVAELAVETARALGLDGIELGRVRTAAELHDIGKCALPQSILEKPEPLDDGEWRFMRQHTLIGARIAQAAPSLAHAADLIRSTHEWFDGTGYPDGMQGEAIPLGARIIAVCDAYDAITSARPYSPSLSSDEALAELRRCAGSQFDPAVVEAFGHVLAGSASLPA